MAERAAVKGDWRAEPMPEKHTTIELNHEYSTEDMEIIKLGEIPEEMEDKWFMYYVQSENKLYMHRSWTGYCVYIVQFEEKADESVFMATTAVVNREESQHNCNNDQEDKRTVLTVISAVMLGGRGSLGDPLLSWGVLGRASTN